MISINFGAVPSLVSIRKCFTSGVKDRTEILKRRTKVSCLHGLVLQRIGIFTEKCKAEIHVSSKKLLRCRFEVIKENLREKEDNFEVDVSASPMPPNIFALRNLSFSKMLVVVASAQRS